MRYMIEYMRKLLCGKGLGRGGRGPRDVTPYAATTYNDCSFFAGISHFRLDLGRCPSPSFRLSEDIRQSADLKIIEKEWRTDLDYADKYYIMVVDS